jgi:integrase
LRLEEVSRLTVDVVELTQNRLFVANGKGRKDRVVYLSKDARFALDTYLTRRSSKAKHMFPRTEGTSDGDADIGQGHQEKIFHSPTSMVWKSSRKSKKENENFKSLSQNIPDLIPVAKKMTE